MGEESASRILDGEAARDLLDAAEREAEGFGGFLVMLHNRETDAFEPQPAVFTAEIEEGNTALCLSIGEQQWVMRADKLIAAIRQAFGKAVQAGAKSDLSGVSESSRSVSGDMGPWIATFRDGPLANHQHDRYFSVGPVQQNLYLMPHPETSDRLDWILVGMDGTEPEEPWPRQLHYRLDTIIEMAGAHGEPVAYYRLSDMPPKEQQ